MKKSVAFIIGIIATAQVASAQDIMDMAANAQCQSQDNALKSLLKSVENEKKGAKAATWLKLAEGYANHTTICGRDSSAALKAWDAAKKAKELDTDGKSASAINSFMKGELLYSAFMNQGVAYYNASDLKNAGKHFLLATEVNAADTLASFYAGIVSNQLGNHEDAIKAFKLYIDEGKGKDPSSYYTLSQIYKERGDINSSIEWLKRGIAETDNKDLRGELVNTYIQNNMLDQAISDLLKLTEIDPNNSNTWLNLGLLYDNNKQMDKALEAYKKSLSLDQDNFDANYSLAVLHFNEAVRIKTEVDAMDIKTYQEKGKAIEEKVCEQFNLSKPYFDKCSKLKPNDTDVAESLSALENILAQCNK